LAFAVAAVILKRYSNHYPEASRRIRLGLSAAGTPLFNWQWGCRNLDLHAIVAEVGFGTQCFDVRMLGIFVSIIAESLDSTKPRGKRQEDKSGQGMLCGYFKSLSWDTGRGAVVLYDRSAWLRLSAQVEW
jgi:hypothetical protein